MVRRRGSTEADRAVIDDYVHLLDTLFREMPHLLLSSPSLSGAFQVAVSALSLLPAEIVRASLDLLLDMAGSPLLSEPAAADAAASAALRAVFVEQGYSLVSTLLSGLVTDFEDTSSTVTLFRVMAGRLPSELAAWVPAACAAGALGTNQVPAADSAAFSRDFAGAMRMSDLNAVRSAFTALDRASRKAKARRLLDSRRRLNEM